MEAQRQGDSLVSKILPNQDEEFSKKRTNASLVVGLEVQEELRSQSSCLAKRKREIIFVFGLCTLFIVILLSTTTAKSRSKPTLLQQLDCAGNREIKPEFGRDTVFSGSFRDCDSVYFGLKKMRIIRRSDPLWDTLQSRLGLHTSDMALSPLIVVPENTCKITLQTKAAILDDVFIISRDPFSYTALTLSPKNDNQISFINATFISSNKSINLLIAPKQSTTVEEVKIYVQRCYNYTRVEETSRASGQFPAQFPRILHHEYDRCSFELYERGIVDCDWLKVTTMSDVTVGEFERVKSLLGEENCFKSGVRSNPVGAKYFIKVRGRSTKEEEFTYAYLLSPILSADVSREFTFSLHADVICNQSELTAYVVGPNLDVLSVPERSRPFLNVSTEVGDWMHHQKVVTIPKEYPEFQILLRAKVKNQGICEYCGLPAHVVIDEIKIEASYPKCPTSEIGNTSFLNSDFQHGTYNNWTHEKWQLASTHRFLEQSISSDWRKKMLSGDHINPLAIGDLHLALGHYFRSPLVIANINCSCVLKFVYTIYDEYDSLIPVHVVQRFGVNATKQVKSHEQKTLWHNILPTLSEWKNIQVPVKLVDNGVPFSFDFNTVSDPSLAPTGWMFFDDIKFEGCDFSLYTGES